MVANRFTATAVPADFDPRLQRIAARRAAGVLTAATASSGVDEVPVIAKVTDAEAWAALSEVRAGIAIGDGENGDGSVIVTGRIPADRIAAVRKLEFVRSLKAAQPLQPALAAGLTETAAAPTALPRGTASDGGRGVVVGIVDYGCDFAHRNFLTAAGDTRLLRLWHQGGVDRADSPNGYGREYLPAEINLALRQPDPYAALGYGPARDTPTAQGTHGTHVMDIAAGNGAGSRVPGFAPQADLIFVDVAHDDLPFGVSEVVGRSFGDSLRLLEAVTYIFDAAGTRPCVVNISLGTNGGPHDGTTLVEQGIDRLLAAAPNRAVTIAAANAFTHGIHAQGRVQPGGVTELRWTVPAAGISDSEFELWYAGEDRSTMELIDPTGASLGRIAPGENGSVAFGGGGTGFAANRLDDPSNRDNMIGVFLGNGAPAGTWTVRLHGDQVARGDFHAWIERNNLLQASFEPPHDNRFTIGSISCGKTTIAVGSYDAHKPSQPISFFSSAGPTRDGREKSEISAPGHAVFAAHSRSKDGVTRKGGTSMAAPAVAGIVALMLAEAQARGRNLFATEIRDLVVASARRSPPPGVAGWDDRFGHGRIDAAAAVAAVMGAPVAMAALPPSAAFAEVAPGGTQRRKKS